MVHVRIVLDQNHMAGPCIPGIQGTTFDIGFPNHRGEFPAFLRQHKKPAHQTSYNPSNSGFIACAQGEL